MTSRDVESGFESLLKPLENITSHVWDIVLTKALKNYLFHTNETVNFTEAAVLVQNSAGFYSKRVDSIHLVCQQFVEQLTDLYNKVFGTNIVMDSLIYEIGKENGDSDNQPVKRKRTAKTYISNDFLPVDCFVSESNIYINLEKIEKNSDRKKIILNKYPKATRKQNTSCPVYQSKGTEMGLKEEFRLHWGISSNGVLNEDFITSRNPAYLDWCALPDEVHDVLRNSFVQLETSIMDFEDNLPDNIALQGEVPSSSPHRGATPDLHVSPLPPNSPLLTENVPVEKPGIKDPYKELLFHFDATSPALVKKQCFSLPKTLIDEVNDWKARRIEKKELAKTPDYTFSYFDFFKRCVLMQTQSGCDVKINKSAKLRRKEIMLRQKQYERGIKEVAVEEYDADFPGYEDQNDDNNEDLDIDAIVPVNIPENITSNYNQDNEDVMAAYQENRRRNAAEMTEVARRVQEWHDSLAHVLDMAESRAQFDVHDYGTRILAEFKEPPEKQPILSFTSIVKNQSRPEISRFLLSSLMLANTYNVEIIQDEGHLKKDCLRLKLLSTVRHHEEMDENLAASHH